MENANKALPIVAIDLDGQVYNIKCSFGVFLRFQKLSGKDPFKSETYANMDSKDYVHLMAACIYTDPNDPPESHIDEVANKMGALHINVLTEVVKKLFHNQAAEEVSEKKELPAAAPTTAASES